ncbi:ionotropic receptor 75a-like isoform X2 [Cylas formicarius]|uniref:ionotropic receptor 75a-like isoform X2 n=1 Tax=Cylas formicarius TaxID=197179 RepID=UPI002958B717|nr:ionotropic receptor 75a-like isoform X2 [Cylas formicarius]
MANLKNALVFNFCVFCLSSVVAFVDANLISSFLRFKHLDRNIVLTCFTKTDLREFNFINSVVVKYKLGVVLDGDCRSSRSLLLKCKRYKCFDSTHYWFILRTSNNYADLLRNVYLNIDCDVKVAYPKESNNFPRGYVIDDVYNPASDRGGELKTRAVGSFDTSHGYHVTELGNKYFVRRNLTGVTFKTVIVLPEAFKGTLEDYLLSDRDIQINTFNRFHSRLLHYCSDYHNFSMDIVVDKSWGYLQSDGTMDGLVGDLERRKIDFGLSPLFVKVDRAKYVFYGRKTWNLRAAFIFRNPRSRKSYQIFIKPLTYQVWAGIIVCSILSVATQKLSYKFDRHNRCVEYSWSFPILCAFGAFCQQGTQSNPNRFCGRIVIIFTLTLGYMVYQFYSASLVSFLLNVPTTLITTLEGLMEHNFKLGCDDVLYNKDYLKYSTDNLTREIHRRILLRHGNGTGFLNPEDGLALVKRGQYAFHVDVVSGYPIIERTYDETTICELREVQMFRVKEMHANYQKHSPFKDLIDTCLHRLAENGVLNRELIFWHPRKPQCLRSKSTIYINTGLEDFYPALFILLIGMIMSLQVLAIELLWGHRNAVINVESVRRVFPYLD